MGEDEEIPLNEIKIRWNKLSDEMKKAIRMLDRGKIAYLLLKKHPETSIDEVCEAANALIKVYKSKKGQGLN